MDGITAGTDFERNNLPDIIAEIAHFPISGPASRQTKWAVPRCLLKKEMRSFLFILALILLIGWGIGVFFYALKGLFNIVIVLAAIAFIMAIFNRSRKT